MRTQVKPMETVFLVMFLLLLSEAIKGEPPPCKTETKCNACANLNILNGIVNDNKPIGPERRAEYSCNAGFTIKGIHTRTCLQNGEWSGKQPVCIKVDLEELENSDEDESDEVTPTSEMRTFVSDKTEDSTPEVSSTPSEAASGKTKYPTPDVSPTPSEAALDGNEASQAVAISVPVVIIVFVIAVIIGVMLWRQSRKSSESILINRNSDTESSIAKGHTSEDHSGTRTSDYAVIPPESLIHEDASGDVYQYIDILPEDQTNNSINYDHMKRTEIQFLDKNYSHITDTDSGQQFIADNTYAHTAAKPNERKDNSDEIDATYNQLQTQTSTSAVKSTTENQMKDTSGIDPTYNQSVAGGPDCKTKTDNYSHINSSRNKDHQYNENASSTKYSSAQSFQYGSQNESQQYNIDNPVSENLNSDLECDNNTDYEEAGGTAHKCFILEPNCTSYGTSFHVVGD